MLAGNADRERGADVLKAAYSEGRLTKDEYDYRLGKAVAARTVEELQLLTADVPNGPSAVPPAFHRPPEYEAYGGSGAGRPVPYRQPHQALPFVPQPPPRRHNAAATGALICGLTGPFTLGATAVPAVILGHKARTEIRRTGERGDGVAVAGLALGWIMLVAVALVVLGAVFG